MPLRWEKDLRKIDKTAEGRKRRLEREATILEAARAGEKVDPENAFFTTIRAALMESLGEHAAAQKALHAASQKRFYNDYASHEAAIKQRVIERTWGYRGNVIATISYASILLPHYASLKKVLPKVAETGGAHDPEAQLSLTRVLDKLVRGTDTIIGILVAKSIFKEAISGFSDSAAPENRDELLDVTTAELDRQLDSTDLSSTWKRFSNLPNMEEHFSKWAEDNTDFFESEVLRPPFWSSWALLVMVLCVPIALLATCISRLKRAVLKRRAEVARPVGWLVAATCFQLSLSWLAMPPLTNATYLEPWTLVAGGICAGSLLLLPKLGARPLALGALIMAVIPVIYLGLTLNELRADRRMGEYIADFRAEADLMRQNWK